MTGRALHAMAAICFRPSHRLVIVGNHKLAIADTSSGMWRRDALVPWTETVPPENRDEQLVRKLMLEGSGVLNWALDGLRDWRQHDLMIPDAIRDATASYREDEDILGDWLDEECEVGRGLFEKKVHAYASYHEWAEGNGNRPPREQNFHATGRRTRLPAQPKSARVPRFRPVEPLFPPSMSRAARPSPVYGRASAGREHHPRPHSRTGRARRIDRGEHGGPAYRGSAGGA